MPQPQEAPGPATAPCCRCGTEVEMDERTVHESLAECSDCWDDKMERMFERGRNP